MNTLNSNAYLELRYTVDFPCFISQKLIYYFITYVTPAQPFSKY